jgi:hypothetical protein
VQRWFDNYMSNDVDNRKCIATVIGYAGAALVAIAACSENLEKYLFATGTFWILAGTFIAACWAWEMHCHGENDEK